MRKKIKNPNMIQRVVINFSPAAAGIDYEQGQRLAFNVLAPIVQKANKKGITKTRTRFPLFATQLQTDDGNVILAFKTRWNEKTHSDLAIINHNKEANQEQGISPFLFFLNYGEHLYDPDWSDIAWTQLNVTPWIIFEKFVTKFLHEHLGLIIRRNEKQKFMSDGLVIQGDDTWYEPLSNAVARSDQKDNVEENQFFDELEEQMDHFVENPVYVEK